MGRFAPDTDGRRTMEIVSPKLVARASELPSLVLVLTAAIGPLLWVLGWRVHRALFVTASTVVGGIYGLVHGPAFGLYPAVAAGLLSLSAGGLALALMRIGVFVVFGGLLDFAAQATIINHLDEEARGWMRVTAFLVGGLMSLACYRFLVIALTSFAGAFLLTLGGLAFAAQQGDADTVSLAADRPALVTSVFVVLGALGTAGQYLLERHRAKDKKDRSREPMNEFVRKLLKVKA